MRARLAAALLALWLGAARAEGLDIPFTLTKPAGDGPFPAVVLLHDCSGLGPRSSGAPWRWSAELTRLGYVTIWPDSFSTRGFPNGVCTEANRGVVGPRRRIGDAAAALAHLRTLPFVDPARVAVMGGSHGGTTTLAVAAAVPGFVAAIALYPACGLFSPYRPQVPVLILVGAADDWTPAAPCEALAGGAVRVETYPGAHHSFDSPAPVRFDPARINPNMAGGRGATTGGQPEAWARAREAVRVRLAEAFGR